MFQTDPIGEFSWDRQDVSQNIDLEFVKVLVDGGIEKRFQFLQSFFYFLFCIGEVEASRRRVWLRFEPETLWRGGQQSCLKTSDSLVDEVVD